MIHTDITEAREAVESYTNSAAELTELANSAREAWVKAANRHDRTRPGVGARLHTALCVREAKGRFDHLTDELETAEFKLFDRTRQLERLEAAEVH